MSIIIYSDMLYDRYKTVRMRPLVCINRVPWTVKDTVSQLGQVGQVGQVALSCYHTYIIKALYRFCSLFANINT